jgi:hypothetical protein
MHGQRAVHDGRVAFPASGSPVRVTTAWLAGTGKESGETAAVRCEISGGLRAGGGAEAAIPPGHLIF